MKDIRKDHTAPLSERSSKILTLLGYLDQARKQDKPWAIEVFVNGLELNEISLVECLPQGMPTEQRIAAEAALKKEVKLLKERLELCRAADCLERARDGKSAATDVMAVKRHLAQANARPQDLGITPEALDALARPRPAAAARR